MPDVARASHLLIRIFAVALIAAVAGACSDLPDWLGGDSAPTQQMPTPADTSAPAGQPGSQGKTVAEASDQYPVLADTPSKAPPTTSTDEQKQVANALMADRSQAQYSADALQAGKEPAAAPPPPASADANGPIPPPSASASADQTGATASALATPPPPVPTRMASAGRAPMPGTLPVEGASPPPATQVASANSAPSTAPMPPPTAPAPSASLAPPPPPAATPRAAPAVAPDDAALGFQPSHAPPLDPAVAQLMGNPTPARRQRLASIGAPAAAAALPRRSAVQFAGTPAAVVAFSANTIALDVDGIAQVQSAVAAWRAKGGQGYVRVVGHAASGASNLPADRQMTQSLERSQACATAVARELIKQGVPANRVLVDASASLSDGEQRRAEIFLQS